MNRLVLIASAVVLMCLSRDAGAQTFINAFAGTTLTAPSTSSDSSNPGFGAALGSIGKLIGAETEVAYYPQLLNNAANGLTTNKVVTISGNTLIGPFIGRVRVYGAAGLGSLFLNVTSASSIFVPTPASISTTYFTVNVGGGAIGFFASHFGVRGDLRYYRAFGFNRNDLQSAGLALDRFDFWRGNIGIVATF